MITLKNLINHLKIQLLEVDFPPEIIAVYIYGSAVKGKMRTDSDLDIGILPVISLKNMDKLILISKIEGIFTSILRKYNLDIEVSVLEMRGRYVPLTLLYKVVVDGVLIYERDSNQRAEFDNVVKREYFDFKTFPVEIKGVIDGHLLKKTISD